MTARYWFRPKRYGLGATPITWEGWAFTALMVVFIGVVTWYFVGMTRAPALAVVLWVLLVGAATALLVVVTKAKTQGEWRWRWGDPE
jgi:hypothetical protein